MRRPVTSLRRKPLEYISSKSALSRAAKCLLWAAVSNKRSVSVKDKNLGNSFCRLGAGNNLNGLRSNLSCANKKAAKLRRDAILRKTVLRAGSACVCNAAKKERIFAEVKYFKSFCFRALKSPPGTHG